MRRRVLTAEERWCAERRKEVRGFLAGESVRHGRIGSWPAWQVEPYVSVWAVESLARPGRVGWWVICGDLPTDYVSSARIKHPRTALRAFAKRWRAVANCMRRGRAHPTVQLGARARWPELEPLLRTRARLLARCANDDHAWQE
jgi:hypothetical protein